MAWRDSVAAAETLIDDRRPIAGIDRELVAIAVTHRYLRLLRTAPGIGPVWVTPSLRGPDGLLRR